MLLYVYYYYGIIIILLEKKKFEIKSSSSSLVAIGHKFTNLKKVRKCETRNASLTKVINALDPKHWDQKEMSVRDIKREYIRFHRQDAPRTDVNVYGRVFKDVVIFGKDSYFNREAADAYYHVAPIRRARWPCT